MKKAIFITGIVFFLFTLHVQAGFGNFGSEIQITIDVAPNVLNLQNQAEVVTIHTDISYSLVVGSTVYLNDIPINSWKSDDRGNFVAKFLMSEVKDLPLNVGEYNELKLVGETVGGVTFWGTQDILILNNIPVGTGKK